MFPRVAFEYGHRLCAASANSCTFALSIPGTSTAIFAANPYPPSASGPCAISTLTVEPDASSPRSRASAISALW